MDWITVYTATWGALGGLATLMLLQVFIADIVAIRARQTPGITVNSGHDDPLFRVSRTVANTNETVAIFILAVLFCTLSGASATYTGYIAWAFVGLRTLYAICYYANWSRARSGAFALSLLALLSLLLLGLLNANAAAL